MDSTSERWLPIPGYGGAYDVSDQGRIRSWMPYRGTAVPRVLHPTLDRAGYEYVSLRRRGVSIRSKVHLMVLLAFVGPRPDRMETRHLDGNPKNNRLGNLAYGTYGENKLDKSRHGTDYNVRKTHCPQGHEYAGDNLYVYPDGRRQCRACARNAIARHYKKTGKR